MKTQILKLKMTALIAGFFLMSCEEQTLKFTPQEVVAPPVEVDWPKAADAAQAALQTEFYSTSQNYFKETNNTKDDFNYWWNAHALDLLVDGYNRTKNPVYLTRMKKLLQGILVKNGNTYRNNYYDDMEWLSLACLRAYDATADIEYKNVAVQLWGWIKGGWTSVKNGGISWEVNKPESKNACSNGPAAIIAARLYQLDKKQDDLDWALKIYAWEKTYLVDASRGLVWDSYGNTTEEYIFTYNQGTYIGAALELYRITKNETYLKDAIRNANYVMNDQNKFSPNKVLKGENSGDGGLFKGIFVRYLGQLAMKGTLDDYTRKSYVSYLKNNGQSLYTKATKLPENVFGPDWVNKPASKFGDCSVHLSGTMLFETIDELKRAGL